MIRLLFERAQRLPDAPVFLAPEASVTYGELARSAQAAAAWLHARGVRSGETVALSFESRPGAAPTQLALFFGLFHLGAPVLPLYPGVPRTTRGELAGRFGARWLIADEPFETPAACARIDVGEYERAAGQGAPAAAPRGDDPARLLRYEFTSGTTGEPKLVALTGAQYEAAAANNVQCFGWTAGDRLLPVAGWPGKLGVRALLQMIVAGGAMVNVPFPATRNLLAMITDHFGVTCLRSVPWQLRQLLRDTSSSHPLPRALRFVETAGARITPQEIAVMRAELTPNLRVSYGSSESGVIAHLRAHERVDAGLELVAGMTGEAVDDAGRALPPGQVGRLRFRASWLPQAYVANPRASAERFAGGWYYPGDAGAIDANGRLTVHGRIDGVINHGGTKIQPRQVEEIIERHPAVAEAVVFGVAHALKGEVPIAFVVPRGDLSALAVREYCESRIDASAVPAVILTVPALPRSADGKVVIDRLREIYREWERQYQAGTLDRSR